MPIGPFPDFDVCQKQIAAQYRKSHPEWTEKHIQDVAKAVCADWERHGAKLVMEDLGRAAFLGQTVGGSTGPDGQYLYVEVNDDSLNKLHWKARREAIEKATKNLKGKPVYAPPLEGKVADVHLTNWRSHTGDFVHIGEVAEVREQNGRVRANLLLKDPDYWTVVPSQLPAVSPGIEMYRAEISFPQENETGQIDVLDFDYNHIMLIPKGAYPNSLVYGKCLGTPEQCSMAHALGGALDLIMVTGAGSSDPSALTDAGGHSPQIGRQTTEERKEENVTNRSDSTLHEGAAWPPAGAPSNYFDPPWEASDFAYHTETERKLPFKNPSSHKIDADGVRAALARFHQTDLPADAKSAVLGRICSAAKEVGVDSDLCARKEGASLSECEKAQLDKLGKDVGTLTASVESLTKDITTIKNQVGSMTQAAQTTKVAAVLQARLGAGLITDKEVASETTRLAAMTPDALDALKHDAEVITEMNSRNAGALVQNKPPTKETLDASREAIENMRSRMLGYTRDNKFLAAAMGRTAEEV